ncbi:Uncharacterized protein TCAP_01975 [Tolypocladium capitatum]|uniref:Uncharacterized protein n=1 Tax=Tolypocladium capitatum TaxID=45235 RepID=A0A2K3QKP4_9HYPO|nr:Uncharacterized protein TCAP_01975 [Tolypocladium capitatum]
MAVASFFYSQKMLPFRCRAGNSGIMSHLLRLPTELQLAICAQLCLHCRGGRVSLPADDHDPDGRGGQAALARLSATCRELRSVAQPFLYHSPVGVKSYFALVGAMLSNPGSIVERLDGDAIGILERAARDLELTWIRDVVRPEWLLVGVLITATRRLETLSLGISRIGNISHHVAAWTGSMVPMASTGLPSLRALRFFYERNEDLRIPGCGYGMSEPRVCALLDAVTSLRHLAFDGSIGVRRQREENPDPDSDAWLYDDDEWLARPLRHVKTLAFVNCDMDYDELRRAEFENLRRVVRLSPCLERFKYNGACLATFNPRYVDAHFTTNGTARLHLWASRVLEALESAQATLRYIYLDLSSSSLLIDTITFRHLVSGEALAKFTRLETLKIDSTSFCRHMCPRCGHNHAGTYPTDNTTCLTALLPKSIRSLTIKVSKISGIGADALTGDIVHLGKKTRQGLFPNLERLTVDMAGNRADGQPWETNIFATLKFRTQKSSREVLAAFKGTAVQVSVGMTKNWRELDDWKLERD